MTATDPGSILDLFSEIETALITQLAGLQEWGLSGNRPGQYVHDVVADELIIQPLLAAGYRVLTEESGVTGTGDITIVVDPIDGSTNASHGLPWYATSLCAVDEEGPLVALVSNLAVGDRYRAIRGEGAEADRVPPALRRAGHAELRTPTPSGVTALGDALIAFSGWPPVDGGWRQYRSYGACALDMCAVATGTFDAFADVSTAHGVWDYLGAVLVCTEAGASVAEANGDQLVVLDHNARRAPVAAATPELLADVLAMRSGW